jgi:hypothetical protein
MFDAVFEVAQAAKEIPKPPAPPQEDKTTKYTGKGSFITTNTKFKGA